jgi:hypothetical protein
VNKAVVRSEDCTFGYHEGRRETLARGISNDERQAVIREWHEIVAITPEGSNLAAASAAVHGLAAPPQTLHKPPLDVAGKHRVLANVNHEFVRRHFLTSTRMSVLAVRNRQARPDFRENFLVEGRREWQDGSDYSMKTQTMNPVCQFTPSQGGRPMSEANQISRRHFVAPALFHRGFGGTAHPFSSRRPVAENERR